MSNKWTGSLKYMRSMVFYSRTFVLHRNGHDYITIVMDEHFTDDIAPGPGLKKCNLKRQNKLKGLMKPFGVVINVWCAS